MNIALFYHSLISCWNHGTAHFLRGIVGELAARGHHVVVHEADDAWSPRQLAADHGPAALDAYRAVYPELTSRRHRGELDLDAALDGVDLVVVHEWTAPRLVARIGAHRARHRGYTLLFHDTHHRAAAAPLELAAHDLRHYDGVLASGRALRDRYLADGRIGRAWVWHQAADVRVFAPRPGRPRDGDLVWIGNWGEGGRGTDLRDLVIGPVVALGLRARAYGVRFPDDARRALEIAGIGYGGWLANHRVPEVLARHAVTIHVPRRSTTRAPIGAPSIRVFEALACGIPLVSAPWPDDDGLFTPGDDFLVARDGAEMRRSLRAVLADRALAEALAARGLATVRARHTCHHRIDELFAIVAELGRPVGGEDSP
ncbi:MAG TPA: glycosyltransferase [Kofleriaceae bacterium]|nr:glycosyltransferase [Kofleriaceae bacterium]